MDMVCKCGSKEFFTEKHGNQTGLYCSDCGKWQKWLAKDEVRLFNHGVKEYWISVKDRLPNCNGQYLVAYHPVCWDDVRYNEVYVDIDSYRELKIPGRKSWAHNKYRLVTHLQPLPEVPRI